MTVLLDRMQQPEYAWFSSPPMAQRPSRKAPGIMRAMDPFRAGIKNPSVNRFAAAPVEARLAPLRYSPPPPIAIQRSQPPSAAPRPGIVFAPVPGHSSPPASVPSPSGARSAQPSLNSALKAPVARMGPPPRFIPVPLHARGGVA